MTPSNSKVAPVGMGSEAAARPGAGAEAAVVGIGSEAAAGPGADDAKAAPVGMGSEAAAVGKKDLKSIFAFGLLPPGLTLGKFFLSKERMGALLPEPYGVSDADATPGAGGGTLGAGAMSVGATLGAGAMSVVATLGFFGAAGVVGVSFLLSGSLVFPDGSNAPITVPPILTAVKTPVPTAEAKLPPTEAPALAAISAAVICALLFRSCIKSNKLFKLVSNSRTLDIDRLLLKVSINFLNSLICSKQFEQFNSSFFSSETISVYFISILPKVFRYSSLNLLLFFP